MRTIIVVLFLSVSCYARDYPLTDVIVKDGDTIEANINLGFNLYLRESIRLEGIDTPEIHTTDPLQKLVGLCVTHWLTDYIKSKQLILRTNDKCERDKFGRPLGTILESGNDLSLIIGRADLAKPYQGGKKKKWTREELYFIYARVKQYTDKVLKALNTDTRKQIRNILKKREHENVNKNDNTTNDGSG